MPKKTLAVLGGAALTLALGVAVSAQPAPTEGTAGLKTRTDRVEGMARFLGLNEQQQEQVRKLMTERRTQHESLREKLEKNRAELEEALSSANPDPAAVGELAIEGHRLHEQGRALHEAQDKAVRALLSPEQQVRFDAMKALRDERMGAGHPMGRGGMPPGRGAGWR